MREQGLPLTSIVPAGHDGNLVDVVELDRAAADIFGEVEIDVYYLHQTINHLYTVELPAARDTATQDTSEEDLELRLRFLRNEIDEKKWKRIVKQREKNIDKARAVEDVVRVFTNSAIELLNFLASYHSIDDKRSAAIQLESLREQFNLTMDWIHRAHGGKNMYITEEWFLV
jgi:hypothetical protein